MEWRSKMKPTYIVPSMKEIENIEWNGYNVVSTFSGAGGSCLGYRMAGYKVVYANEFIPEAQKTYKMNHPKSYLDTRDIRNVTADDIFKFTGLKRGEIDIFDGSPPCADFSVSGKRDENWGKVKCYSDTKQRVDDLFFEYSRLIKELQPKVFIAENVSGLIRGKAKGYFKAIMKELKACGYKVKASLLNSKWLGVPQSRERLIFIGVRNDLNAKPVYPKPKKYYYTLSKSFDGLKENNEEDSWKLPDGKMKKLYRHAKRNTKKHKGYFSHSHKELYGKESFFNHKIALKNKPSPTIAQSSPCVYHYDEP